VKSLNQHYLESVYPFFRPRNNTPAGSKNGFDNLFGEFFPWNSSSSALYSGNVALTILTMELVCELLTLRLFHEWP